jgi:hypothetical protein
MQYVQRPKDSQSFGQLQHVATVSDASTASTVTDSIVNVYLNGAMKQSCNGDFC